LSLYDVREEQYNLRKGPLSSFGSYGPRKEEKERGSIRECIINLALITVGLVFFFLVVCLGQH